MSQRRPSRESGQATSYVVGVSVLLFAIMGLAFDVGILYFTRRVAQNAADAAALAGATELEGCGDENPDPLALADDYAGRNMAARLFGEPQPDDIVSQIGSFDVDGNDYPTVRAAVRRRQALVFANFLGILNSNVPAEAEAVCAPAEGGGVCPFSVEANSYDAENPENNFEYDSQGRLTRAYGIEIGKVYTIKASAQDSENGNFHILQLIEGSAREAYREYVGAGCETDADSAVTVEEDDILTDTIPGDKNGLTAPAMETLYAPELSNSALFPNGHASCNIPFALDADGADNVPGTPDDGLSGVLDPDGPGGDDPLTGPEAVDYIDDLAASTACNGLYGTGESQQVPGLITDAVSGRFIQIVLVDDFPNGASDPAKALGVLKMYIVCWDNYDPGNGSCGTGVPPGQKGLYGVLGDFKSPDLLKVSGLSNNPLAPKHVVLVR